MKQLRNADRTFGPIYATQIIPTKTTAPFIKTDNLKAKNKSGSKQICVKDMCNKLINLNMYMKS